jgi:hypothetical protein
MPNFSARALLIIIIIIICSLHWLRSMSGCMDEWVTEGWS